MASDTLYSFTRTYRGSRAPGAVFALILTVAVNGVLFGALGWINTRAARPTALQEPMLRNVIAAPKLLQVQAEPRLHQLPPPVEHPPDLRVHRPRQHVQEARPVPQPRRAPLPNVDLDLRRLDLPIAGQLALPALAVLAEDGLATSGDAMVGVDARYDLPEVDQPPRTIRRVRPVYPAAARRRGLSGWVQLAFVVSAEGRVEEIRVLDASNRHVFDQAATQALRQWNFEPAIKDGSAVATRCQVRMDFRLEQ